MCLHRCGCGEGEDPSPARSSVEIQREPGPRQARERRRGSGWRNEDGKESLAMRRGEKRGGARAARPRSAECASANPTGTAAQETEARGGPRKRPKPTTHGAAPLRKEPAAGFARDAEVRGAAGAVPHMKATL